MSAKKTGKLADDIFAPTTRNGTAVTVTLDAADIDFVDELAADVAESRGLTPDRAEVIRNLVGVVRKKNLLGKRSRS